MLGVLEHDDRVDPAEACAQLGITLTPLDETTTHWPICGKCFEFSPPNLLKDNARWRVLVEGHCDERGTAEYNLGLGEQRALSTKRYLVSLGVGESRFQTISYGEERPVDRRSNEEAWAKNRRAEFRVEAPGS